MNDDSCWNRAKVSVLMAFVLSMVSFAVSCAAQSPPPLANPNLDLGANGAVLAIVRAADGGWVFGGYFTSVNGTPRAHLAKLKADGTLDANFNASADDTVIALATDSAGNVYVGGSFTMLGGQPRSRLAKISSTGAIDLAWNPGADGPVYALVADTANVYAGGYFLTLGGQPRNRLAKLSATGAGAVDATWNPSADNAVLALARDNANNIYAVGQFQNMSGVSHRFLAKIPASGSGLPDAAWNPGGNGYVYSVVTDNAGHVYAGGDFTFIGGSNSVRVAKIDSSGEGIADPNWTPIVNEPVLAIALDGGGNAYIGGVFTRISGQDRVGIAKIGADGAVDPTFDPSADIAVRKIVLGSAGAIYVGGEFTHIGGQARQALAALPAGDRLFGNGFELPQ